jgi:hypothetical protein
VTRGMRLNTHLLHLVLWLLPHKRHIYLRTSEPKRIPDSVVGIATGYVRSGRLGGRSSSPCRVKNFLFSTSLRPALRSTQRPIQWVAGALSPGVQRPGREANDSLASS